MRALVVFESVYGNTHDIAAAIASGLASELDVETAPVDEASSDLVAASDLLVIGGPTHAHGMTSTRSREGAVDGERHRAEQNNPKKPAHELDDAATGEGLREWFHGLPELSAPCRSAAFDTRFDKPRWLTGSAARGIGRRLRRHGCEVIAEPESFFVEHAEGPLAEGEFDRATQWGEVLASKVAAKVS